MILSSLHAVHHPRPAEPAQADGQIHVLHDGQAGVAAPSREEVGPAEEHRMVAEQRLCAAQEQMEPEQQRIVGGLGPVAQAGPQRTPPAPLSSDRKLASATRGSAMVAVITPTASSGSSMSA